MTTSQLPWETPAHLSTVSLGAQWYRPIGDCNERPPAAERPQNLGNILVVLVYHRLPRTEYVATRLTPDDGLDSAPNTLRLSRCLSSQLARCRRKERCVDNWQSTHTRMMQHSPSTYGLHRSWFRPSNKAMPTWLFSGNAGLACRTAIPLPENETFLPSFSCPWLIRLDSTLSSHDQDCWVWGPGGRDQSNPRRIVPRRESNVRPVEFSAALQDVDLSRSDGGLQRSRFRATISYLGSARVALPLLPTGWDYSRSRLASISSTCLRRTGSWNATVRNRGVLWSSDLERRPCNTACLRVMMIHSRDYRMPRRSYRQGDHS